MLARVFLACLAALALAGGAQAKSLAITFDDLPATGPDIPGETRMEVADKVIAALKAAHVPAVYGFVNGISLEADATAAKVLPAWRRAGFLLGSHTWSHIDLDESAESEFEADVLRDEPVLRKAMGRRDWRWFRYPYLSVGRTPQAQTQARTFLRQHGYRIAAVTMDFADYAFDDPYARCVEKGDSKGVARLQAAYMQAAADAVDYSRQLSLAAFGREIPYVLLLHIGHIDSVMLPRLLSFYRARGFTFITLKKAEADPFYRADVDPRAPSATDNLATAVAEHGLPVPQDKDLSWLDAVCA